MCPNQNEVDDMVIKKKIYINSKSSYVLYFKLDRKSIAKFDEK